MISTIYTSCVTCNYNRKQKIKFLIKKFSNTYQIANNNSKKLILLLKKGVYPYEYIDNWLKFDEKELPSPDKFYSTLNLKNILTKDYEHAKKSMEKF